MRAGALEAARSLALADRAVVLGNGPSLRHVDLAELSSITTIGMNAAYRHWDRIGWYPTHYCCLDEELIVTHRERIRALVLDGLVETAFVTGRLLEFYPALAADPRFFFLDSVRPHTFRQRGQALGLREVVHPAFTTAAPTKVTTGAYAVRYAIYLGFRQIYVAGIDCRYVEVLDEAQKVGDIALQITETPQANPNYFFADYQQEGDRYNIPNPEVHGGNLHLQAMQAVRDDIVLNGIATELFNSSEESLLSEDGIYPFQPLSRALGRDTLSAVAVPFTPGEEAALSENLERWNEPGLIPRLPMDSPSTTALVLVLNGSRDAALEDRVRKVFDALPNVVDSFAALEFQYCELSADDDYYERDYSKDVGPGGFKAGPNAQFFRAMELLRPYGGYVFQMETDCYPVRPGWLTALERLVASRDPFWVMGSIYRGVDTIAPGYRDHINGNAIYAVGDPAFHEFLAEVWRPAMAELVQTTRTLAYDCVLPLLFSSDEGGWEHQQRTAHRFLYTDFIQNHAGRAELETGAGQDVRQIRAGSPDTYLVHGRHLRPDDDAGTTAPA